MNKKLQAAKDLELFRGLFAYACVAALAFGFAVFRDSDISNAAFSQKYSPSYPDGNSHMPQLLLYVAIAILYYFGRLIFLKYLSMKKSKNIDGRKAAYAAMVWSVPIEIFTWFSIIGMLSRDVSNCGLGFESSCGWGLFLVMPIIAAGLISLLLGVAASGMPNFKSKAGKK